MEYRNNIILLISSILSTSLFNWTLHLSCRSFNISWLRFLIGGCWCISLLFKQLMHRSVLWLAAFCQRDLIWINEYSSIMLFQWLKTVQRSVMCLQRSSSICWSAYLLVQKLSVQLYRSLFSFSTNSRKNVSSPNVVNIFLVFLHQSSVLLFIEFLTFGI